MAKSVRRPTSRTGATKGKKTSSGIDTLRILELGVNVINSVTSTMTTVADERRKTAEVILEGTKINAEINDRISQRENETAKILKEYEIELKKIDESINSIETKSNENIRRIDFEIEQSKQEHEYRMRGLDIIEKIVDIALEQYRFYKDDSTITNEYNVYVVNTDVLNIMNGTIQQLTATIAQANIGGLLQSFEGE